MNNSLGHLWDIIWSLAVFFGLINIYAVTESLATLCKQARTSEKTEETALPRCSEKQLILEFVQNSQENTCAGVSF